MTHQSLSEYLKVDVDVSTCCQPAADYACSSPGEKVSKDCCANDNNVCGCDYKCGFSFG